MLCCHSCAPGPHWYAASKNELSDGLAVSAEALCQSEGREPVVEVQPLQLFSTNSLPKWESFHEQRTTKFLINDNRREFARVLSTDCIVIVAFLTVTLKHKVRLVN